jgi:hypothetical protein
MRQKKMLTYHILGMRQKNADLPHLRHEAKNADLPHLRHKAKKIDLLL